MQGVGPNGSGASMAYSRIGHCPLLWTCKERHPTDSDSGFWRRAAQVRRGQTCACRVRNEAPGSLDQISSPIRGVPVDDVKVATAHNFVFSFDDSSRKAES